MIDKNLEWNTSWGQVDWESKDAGKITQQVKDLIKAGADVNLRSPSEQTVLMIAAWEGYTEVAEQAIAAGAKLNLKDKMGFTALTVAAGKGQTEIFEKLVEAGAWIDPKDYRKETPLMHAAFFGNIDIVKRLLVLGADTSLVDDQGKTAEDWALEGSKEDVFELLVDVKYQRRKSTRQKRVKKAKDARAKMRAKIQKYKEEIQSMSETLMTITPERHALAVKLNEMRKEFGSKARHIAKNSRVVKALRENARER